MTDISFLGDSPYARIKKLMQILRSEKGCPWDKEQTFETIAPYTIEEAYEVKEAIDRKDMNSLKEELGDLLFQVIFHSQIASEQNTFTLEDVFDALSAKMVRRHPHVFTSPDGNPNQNDQRSSKEQTKAWEAVKAEERDSNSSMNSMLDDVPLALPALMRAEKLQKRAARVGFDWSNLDDVWAKISEETAEVAEAIESGSCVKIVEELGDLLFAVTNLARKLDCDPEQALRQTNLKFTRRFQHIEARARSMGITPKDMSLKQMDLFWDEAKNAETSSS